MRVVSYTRSTASLVGEEIPGDIITKQNAAIREYAKAHDLKIAKTYSDRKYDADENTAFEELLQDGINRQFDAVIIHSIFRCGRDLWSAKEVLLQTFHAAGIGFIVVEDDFSSIGKTNAEAEAYFESKYSFHKQETIRRKVNHRNKSGILSVSYTHLDVYKRQATRCLRNKVCLLRHLSFLEVIRFMGNSWMVRMAIGMDFPMRGILQEMQRWSG